MTLALLSPLSGKALRPDTAHSLSDGATRWPVIDGIAYLRTGRERLAVAVLALLDAGDETGALVALLSDQDDWWDGPAQEQADLRRLVAERGALTLREAMRLLAYGRVGDYFAHRWSDPTFLAGLALIEAHWAEPRSCFELACGIGHYLRELDQRGVAATGGDVVFSKLWLARHWVVGERVELCCFDAGQPWPVAGLRADLAICQDAFYFLEPKREILSALREIAEGGTVAVGHIHNREAANLSSGAALSAAEIAELFPDGLVYDDDELTRAAAEARAPRPAPAGDMRGAEAFSVVAGLGLSRTPLRLDGRLTLPREGARLTRNPLYAAMPDARSALIWPSERYRREYGSRATYPRESTAPSEELFGPGCVAAARRRELVALPERW